MCTSSFEYLLATTRCCKTFHQSALKKPFFVIQMLLNHTFISLRIDKWAPTDKLHLQNCLSFWAGLNSSVSQDEAKISQRAGYNLCTCNGGECHKLKRTHPLCASSRSLLSWTAPFVPPVAGSCVPCLPLWIIESEDLIRCLYRDY